MTQKQEAMSSKLDDSLGSAAEKTLKNKKESPRRETVKVKNHCCRQYEVNFKPT